MALTFVHHHRFVWYDSCMMNSKKSCYYRSCNIQLLSSECFFFFYMVLSKGENTSGRRTNAPPVLLKMGIRFATDVSAAVSCASSAGFVINTCLFKSLMMITAYCHPSDTTTWVPHHSLWIKSMHNFKNIQTDTLEYFHLIHN